MSWNPATSDKVIPPGNRHLIIGDSLVRDLNEIFVYGQTTALSFGGASVAQVIKMMEFKSEDYLDTLVIMLGTNDVSRAPVTPESKWEPLLVCLLNELKEKYRPKLVVLCTIPQNPRLSSEMGAAVAVPVARGPRWLTRDSGTLPLILPPADELVQARELVTLDSCSTSLNCV